MKKSDVKTGEVYSAKVSGDIVPVRIDRENPSGGWDGTNMKTRKSVRIKSAQRLRGKAATWPGKPATKPAAKADDGAAAPKSEPVKGATAPTAQKKRQPEAEKKDRKPSGLDAAAQVLGEAGEPLNTKEMVERMLAQGLWSTGGKTPSATIYAAITREIAAKGADARFRKVARGKFELAQ